MIGKDAMLKAQALLPCAAAGLAANEAVGGVALLEYAVKVP